MERIQAYRYELMPDGEQARRMRRYAGACRFVFNRALALQQQNHEAGNKYIGYVAMAKHLTAWRNDPATPWLGEAPCHLLQHALKDLYTAYKNFFAGRADFPEFRRKVDGNGFRFPDRVQIRLDQANGRIFLPKLGWMRFRNSRHAVGELRNVTVSFRGGKYFISVQTRRDVGQPLPEATSAVGVDVDVGVKRFATFSDGVYLAPLNTFNKHQHRLARHQRRLKHKVKLSNNWKKANAKDLQIQNMTASARGTPEKPGAKVRQKAGLNRAILDQGWGEFRCPLDYKLAWSGGMLLAVPAHRTSQQCPCCGHVAKENRPTQTSFRCVSCGHSDHADVVGAINVLARGMQMLRAEGQDTGDASPGRGTAARIACQVNVAVRTSAAGTRRSDRAAQRAAP